MHIRIYKGERRLILLDGETIVLSAPVALGRVPVGPKTREGDGKTPEGIYTLCLIKPDGKYGRSLGLSYPSESDARKALDEHAIDIPTFRAIVNAQRKGQRPPWGTALGGEIYIHEGGTHRDWTEGCIALNSADMDTLFPYHSAISSVEILP